MFQRRNRTTRKHWPMNDSHEWGTTVGRYLLALGIATGSATTATSQTYTTIDYPQANQTTATGISGGNIVGYYQKSGGTGGGFLYNGSSLTSIDDPLTTTRTLALGISGSNIVGAYTDSAKVFSTMVRHTQP
jgi:hypothetical protein